MTTSTKTSFFSNYCWNNNLYSNINTDENRIGRIIACDRGLYLCALPEGKIHARPMKGSDPEGREPATGDWVMLEEKEHPRIIRILPRATALQRRDPGRMIRAQAIAVNCDIVLIQISSEEGLRSGKALRLAEAAWESGASPVLLLSKIDLSDEPDMIAAGYRSLLPGVPVLPICAVNGEGMEALNPHVACGTTAVLIGASGSGKSTLLNRLMGKEAQKTGAVRETDRRGRHTTVRRMLFRLPAGGCLIDTPGIREWAIWTENHSEHRDEILELAVRCRFRNCTHMDEPGCAVTEAVRNRELPREVYRHFLKQRREQESLEIRRSVKARRDEEKSWARMRKTANCWRREKRNTR